MILSPVMYSSFQLRVRLGDRVSLYSGKFVRFSRRFVGSVLRADYSEL